MCSKISERDKLLLDMLFYGMCLLCLGLIVGHASAATPNVDFYTIPGSVIVTYVASENHQNVSSNWTAPAGVTSIDYLIVAGGGGGGGSPTGSSGAGGGGAGGYLNGTSLAVTPGTDYPIFVGRGGAGGAAATGETGDGRPGINTTAFGLTAAYGGGGAGSSNRPGIAGASAGGSSNGDATNTAAIVLDPVQGFHGGKGGGASNYPGGGGGGASEHGADATGTVGGAGGAGKSTSISGANAWYSGGGAGAADAGSAALGGSGVGGNGGAGATLPTNATVGRGGGGGGADSVANAAGSYGGSGVVIIRYTYASAVLDHDWISSAGCWTYSDGTDMYYKWNATGTKSWVVPSNATSVWYTVVAGGGGGGGYDGGGGGAGQTANGTLAVTPDATITIIVGAGGTGGNYILGNEATAGGFSLFDTVNATGGSRGSMFLGGAPGGGYNGGGASYTDTGGDGSNHDGGDGAGAGGQMGGGGAGQGGDGADGTSGFDGGQGGIGVLAYILNYPFGLSGGGGGGTDGNAFVGTGGQAVDGYGGGDGNSDDDVGGYAALSNTGGGGGASGTNVLTGGAGGSGIVIIRYTPYVEPAASPEASFTQDVTIGLQNLAVAFTDTSITDITAWNWSFGNGNFSETQSPTYTYYTLGNHTVTLTVTNASGTDVSDNHYVEVLQRYAPIVNFTTNVSSGYVPLDVGFTDISFTDITAWNWSFGTPAGNYSELQNPSFSFTEVGEVPITLQVTNASGTSSTTLYITTSELPDPPLCMFTPATNRSVLWPAGIKLTSTSTNSPTNMSWSWGDGVTTYGTVSSKHIYAFPGIYNINVSATNAGGTTYNETYVQVIL